MEWHVVMFSGMTTRSWKGVRGYFGGGCNVMGCDSWSFTVMSWTESLGMPGKCLEWHVMNSWRLWDGMSWNKIGGISCNTLGHHWQAISSGWKDYNKPWQKHCNNTATHYTNMRGILWLDLYNTSPTKTLDFDCIARPRVSQDAIQLNAVSFNEIQGNYLEWHRFPQNVMLSAHSEEPKSLLAPRRNGQSHER